jgi:hypothetical protein
MFAIRKYKTRFVPLAVLFRLSSAAAYISNFTLYL